MKTTGVVALHLALIAGLASAEPVDRQKRAEVLKHLEWGMFV